MVNVIEIERIGEPGYIESLRSKGLNIEVLTQEQIEESMSVPEDPSKFYFKKGDEVKIVSVNLDGMYARHYMRGVEGKTFIIERALFVPVSDIVNFQSIDLVGEDLAFDTTNLKLVRRA